LTTLTSFPYTILISLVAYWHALNIACPKYMQLKGAKKFNGAQNRTLFNAKTRVSKFVPSS